MRPYCTNLFLREACHLITESSCRPSLPSGPRRRYVLVNLPLRDPSIAIRSDLRGIQRPRKTNKASLGVNRLAMLILGTCIRMPSDAPEFPVVDTKLSRQESDKVGHMGQRRWWCGIQRLDAYQRQPARPRPTQRGRPKRRGRPQQRRSEKMRRKRCVC